MKCKFFKSLHFMGDVMIMQDRWKLFSLDRVKISAIMVGQRRKIKKKTLAKVPYSSPPPPLKKKNKKKIGAKYNWFDISHSEFYSSTRSSTRFSVHHQIFFLISGFLAESLKANKLAKKKDPFYNTVTIHFSFYEPQLTKHWKQYARATQPKTFVTLQTCFGLAS